MAQTDGGRPVSPEARSNLAEQQAALVRALAGESGAPDGFNGDHVATAAASLLAKRRRGVEKTWPGVAESLGGRFRSMFAQYARAHPLPAEGAYGDGRKFARYLRQANQLADDGRLQLLLAELGGRRPIGVALLPHRRAFVMAFGTFGGARWFTIPLPRLRRRRRADFSQPLSPAAK